MPESRQQRRARERAEAKRARRKASPGLFGDFGDVAPVYPDGPGEPAPHKVLRMGFDEAMWLEEARQDGELGDVDAMDGHEADLAAAEWLTAAGLRYAWVDPDESGAETARRAFGYDGGWQRL